jgi:hypothetical protein
MSCFLLDRIRLQPKRSNKRGRPNALRLALSSCFSHTLCLNTAPCRLTELNAQTKLGHRTGGLVNCWPCKAKTSPSAAHEELVLAPSAKAGADFNDRRLRDSAADEEMGLAPCATTGATGNTQSLRDTVNAKSPPTAAFKRRRCSSAAALRSRPANQRPTRGSSATQNCASRSA